jgi:hypothetical protein
MQSREGDWFFRLICEGESFAFLACFAPLREIPFSLHQSFSRAKTPRRKANAKKKIIVIQLR